MFVGGWRVPAVRSHVEQDRVGEEGGYMVCEYEVHVGLLADEVERHDGPRGEGLVVEERGEADGEDGEGGDDEGVRPCDGSERLEVGSATELRSPGKDLHGRTLPPRFCKHLSAGGGRGGWG